jgi:hypothetical protein
LEKNGKICRVWLVAIISLQFHLVSFVTIILAYYIFVFVTKFSVSLHVQYTAEEKEPYEAKAQEDKKRYKDEMSGYNKNPQPMNIDSGNESDSA